MRYAIIVEDNNIVVEYSEEDFRKLFRRIFNEMKDFDKAFDRVKEILNKKLRTL